MYLESPPRSGSPKSLHLFGTILQSTHQLSHRLDHLGYITNPLVTLHLQSQRSVWQLGWMHDCPYWKVPTPIQKSSSDLPRRKLSILSYWILRFSKRVVICQPISTPWPSWHLISPLCWIVRTWLRVVLVRSQISWFQGGWWWNLCIGPDLQSCQLRSRLFVWLFQCCWLPGG